jgi:NAD(P)-dependent dehydrogenase (short-subunit alcohol dehydrogenase family)
MCAELILFIERSYLYNAKKRRNLMKTWLITGCSDGLGKGIAQAVLENGDRAVVTARDAEHVRHFETEYPQQALALALDLSRAESIEEAVDAAQHFGPIDVLVNNAGHGYRAAIEESEPEAVRELFETNFFGSDASDPCAFAFDAAGTQRSDHQCDSRSARCAVL